MNTERIDNFIATMATVTVAGLIVSFDANALDSDIYVQCPAATQLHPGQCDDMSSCTADAECAGIGGELCTPPSQGIRCKHLMAGDGMVHMADDAAKDMYVFSFADVKLPDEAIPGDIPSLAEYPGWVMTQGMLAANAPAPTIEVDEDDEFFLTLTNVGMVMRPDLFDPHTVHWHGFPQAASVFDGVPDASISINMGASLTYYYHAVDAGTYMYHCHVEATEHMQMGMLGNLFVRPRQNRCDTDPAIACPPGHLPGHVYAYNDDDGSTRYDVEYPIQMGSFDPDFHDASFNVQPLPFAGMRDRYFLLNGRGYPDTVNPATLSTVDPMGNPQPSQPVSSLITADAGQRILLRVSNLNVTQFNTLATNGPPMEVVGLDARLLQDGAGNKLYYMTQSLTLGGGQSADVIIDTTGLAPGSTYMLYTANLNYLANDAENFGGMMTEIRINP
jgi:FtsP/CotA-like multicopper oxidase with cupredoxin domain